MATFNQKKQVVDIQHNAETIHTNGTGEKKGQPDASQQQAPSSEHEISPDNNDKPTANWEKMANYAFGVMFLIALLVIAIQYPDPTASQYAIFKTILAVAAAGIGGILTGFLHIKGTVQKITFRAGGALALFFIVFFFTPTPPKPVNNEIKQVIEDKGTGAIHTGSGDINLRK